MWERKSNKNLQTKIRKKKQLKKKTSGSTIDCHAHSLFQEISNCTSALAEGGQAI
jgi:hypothetical protein